MPPERFVVAAEHGGQTVDLWKLVRYQHRFVAFSCEFPTYHRSWKDGHRPHATAQDELESSPIHPDLAAAIQAHRPDRKAKHQPQGRLTRWSDIEDFMQTTGLGFIYPDDFSLFPTALNAVALEKARRAPGDRTRRSDRALSRVADGAHETVPLEHVHHPRDLQRLHRRPMGTVVDRSLRGHGAGRGTAKTRTTSEMIGRADGWQINESGPHSEEVGDSESDEAAPSGIGPIDLSAAGCWTLDLGHP
jgi:hypothetical protein